MRTLAGESVRGRCRAAVIVVCFVAVAAFTACGDSDEDRADPTAFCAAATDVDRLEDLFAELDLTDLDRSIVAFSEARDIERDLRRTAPDAVRSDLEILVTFFEDLVEGLETTDTSTDVGGEPGNPPIYEELRPRFAQIGAASDRVELYVTTNC